MKHLIITILLCSCAFGLGIEESYFVGNNWHSGTWHSDVYDPTGTVLKGDYDFKLVLQSNDFTNGYTVFQKLNDGSWLVHPGPKIIAYIPDDSFFIDSWVYAGQDATVGTLQNFGDLDTYVLNPDYIPGDGSNPVVDLSLCGLDDDRDGTINGFDSDWVPRYEPVSVVPVDVLACVVQARTFLIEVITLVIIFLFGWWLLRAGYRHMFRSV